MTRLLEKINKYLVVQEKKDAISLSLDKDAELNDIIKMVRKSKDRDKVISMFNDEIREQIKRLIEGGII